MEQYVSEKREIPGSHSKKKQKKKPPKNNAAASCQRLQLATFWFRLTFPQSFPPFPIVRAFVQKTTAMRVA